MGDGLGFGISFVSLGLDCNVCNWTGWALVLYLQFQIFVLEKNNDQRCILLKFQGLFLS